MALDGLRWDVDDKTRHNCPLLVRCRCLLLPVTKTWRELGFDIDEMEEAYRPWTEREPNREIFDYGSTADNFPEWFMTRSTQFQNNAVGIRRAELIRAGTIDFRDIVDSRGTLILIADL